MSEARRLWIRFRRIDHGRESVYADAAAALAKEVETRDLRLWVFRVESEPGLVVEFLEGSSVARLQELARRSEVVLGQAGGRLHEPSEPLARLLATDGLGCIEIPTAGRS